MEFLFLFLLMMIDFLLTHLGISLGIIIEGNGLMIWLLQLPIIWGFIIKTILSIGLLTPIYLAKIYKKEIYKSALIIVYVAYGLTMLLHLVWVGYYLFI